MSTAPSMTWRSFALHVVAGLVGITFMGLGIAAIASRRPPPVQPSAEDADAPRSETP